MTENQYRTCTKCKQEYPETSKFFRRAKKSKGGLDSQCRQCSNKAKRENYAKNPEKYRSLTSEYRAKNPEKIRSALREYGKRRRLEQPEIVRTKKREEYARNIDRYRKWRKEYYEKTRYEAIESAKQWRERLTGDKKKQYNRVKLVSTERRLARKKGLPDDFTVEDEKNALEYFEYRCAVCGRQFGNGFVLALDHWIPLDHATCPGTIPSNIVPLCHARAGYSGGCNNSKSFKMPLDWLRDRFDETTAITIYNRVEGFLNERTKP